MWLYFRAGTTVRRDDQHVWSTSFLGTYEIHTHKKDSDFKVGDILTVEGRTGTALCSPTRAALLTGPGAGTVSTTKISGDLMPRSTNAPQLNASVNNLLRTDT
jgi:hypothetical protein